MTLSKLKLSSSPPVWPGRDFWPFVSALFALRRRSQPANRGVSAMLLYALSLRRLRSCSLPDGYTSYACAAPAGRATRALPARLRDDLRWRHAAGHVASSIAGSMVLGATLSGRLVSASLRV